MKTKLDYYRIFYETARHSSFSTAAQHLYISQSAISQCIHQLEKDLNTLLFVRSRRGISLTKEGKLLFQKIESAMLSIEQGEMLLARLHHLDSGSLTIAAGDTITTHFLLPYLEKFHKTYPNIKIEMANSYSHHMLQMVKEGQAELAFINMPVEEDKELCIISCKEIQDIFICGAEFNKKQSYSWQDISKEQLILLEENSSSRHFLNENFAKKRIPLKPHIEIAAHELLIKFASIHLGISCVVKEFSHEALVSGKVAEIPLAPPLPKRHIGCAYLKHNNLSLAAQAFLKLLEDEKK